MSCVYVIRSDFCSLPTDSYLSFTLINDPFILPLLHVSRLFSYFFGGIQSFLVLSAVLLKWLPNWQWLSLFPESVSSQWFSGRSLLGPTSTGDWLLACAILCNPSLRSRTQLVPRQWTGERREGRWNGACAVFPSKRSVTGNSLQSRSGSRVIEFWQNALVYLPPPTPWTAAKQYTQCRAAPERGWCIARVFMRTFVLKSVS